LKQIILGTAGHIDHGKTSLIKAVTGINTDRLKEEQERGITIELGFASLDLPSGQRLGIVDVPGHEKFVKNMVAGATGIDLVAMVIAADEGIMPQTREHMEICILLGIQYGLVVLTKIDMVEEEWLAMVQEEVAQFTRDTFLENAPVVPVSSYTGQGIPEFIQTLDRISAAIPARKPTGLLRLPVDRVFSMKGFGTVITGTLISGKVAVGDRIVLYPSGISSKVRGLQVHGQSVETAEAGLRTAINFQGLDKDQVNRGDTIAAPDTLAPSYIVDVSLHYLSSNTRPLKNRARIRFHTGTSEIMGMVILMDREELAPGQAVAAQIHLETPVTLVKDDRFVARSYSPVRTIGGGRILDPIPAKHKRNRPEVIAHLNELTQAAPDEVAQLQIAAAGYGGRVWRDLLLLTNLPEKQLDKIAQELMSHQRIMLIDREKRLFIHHRAFEDLRAELRRQIEAYHTANPLKPGMPKEELKSKLPAAADAKLFTLALNHMIKSGEVAQEEEFVRLSDHRVSLGVDQQALRQKILTTYLQAGLLPPYFKEFCQTEKTPLEPARQVLSVLVDEGMMVKIKEDLYYHQQPMQALKDKLIDFLVANGEISTPQFKEMTGASRKYVIPILEYFDATQLTIRVGDIRKLRKKPVS
jgi:selenocysteine-specific elongation factor